MKLFKTYFDNLQKVAAQSTLWFLTGALRGLLTSFSDRSRQHRVSPVSAIRRGQHDEMTRAEAWRTEVLNNFIIKKGALQFSSSNDPISKVYFKGTILLQHLCYLQTPLYLLRLRYRRNLRYRLRSHHLHLHL